MENYYSDANIREKKNLSRSFNLNFFPTKKKIEEQEIIKLDMQTSDIQMSEPLARKICNVPLAGPSKVECYFNNKL